MYVVLAAAAVVLEVRRQKKERPGIMDGSQKPDYAACVSIVTAAALREMIIPALLPVAALAGAAAAMQLTSPGPWTPPDNPRA